MATARVYSSSAEGRALARRKIEAVHLAEQRLSTLAVQGVNALPACGTEMGCRDEAGELRPSKGSDGSYPCTQLIDGASLTDRFGSEGSGVLRVDTNVWTHADANQRSQSQMVRVSVCWRDIRGKVHQTEAQRLVLDEVGS